MRRRLIAWLLCAAILFSFTVAAAAMEYNRAEITVESGGNHYKEEVLQNNKGKLLVPVTWLSEYAYAYHLIIALACSAFGLLFGILANKNRKLLAVNVALSVIGLVFMFVFFGEQDAFTETGVGFYLFAIMHLAAIIFSIVALTRPAEEKMDIPVPAKKAACPNCGKTVSEEQLFCDGCGADLRKKPEPPKENRCKACGKVIDKGVAFCRYCGAPVKDNPRPITPPAPPALPAPPAPPVPRPVPGPDKAKRTAICPPCGAKQPEGTATCKYCGTSM